ncbi:MAG: hypothetical protein M3N31_03655 [Actinomycetota bacterium]|nr:hypothetical protein [Actinomycetota bacterium]
MADDPLPPEDEDFYDQLREMPVGTNDPNIVGDAGPTDVPPGTDPASAPREPVAEELPEEEAPGSE